MKESAAEKGTNGNYKRQEDVEKAKKGRVVKENYVKGRRFEETCLEDIRKFAQVVEEQVTIKVGSHKIRVDAIACILDENGNETYQIFEFKSSDTARFTKNQAALFPILHQEGGVIVGKKQGFFAGGKIIPKGTTIEVIRGTEGGKWYVSDRFEQGGYDGSVARWQAAIYGDN